MQPPIVQVPVYLTPQIIVPSAKVFNSSVAPVQREQLVPEAFK